MQHEVNNLEELRAQAQAFLSNIMASPQKKTATVVGLSGDLGSGKTAFTKCIASMLGITETITSPTFILEKIYSIPRGTIVGGRFTKLVHIDAYRLESSDEMRALNWESVLSEEHNLVFLEWPEKVKEVLPEDMITISFEYVDEKRRSITFPVWQ